MLGYHNVYQRVVKCVCMLTAHNAQQHTSEPDLSTVRCVSLYYCCSHRLAHV